MIPLESKTSQCFFFFWKRKQLNKLSGPHGPRLPQIHPPRWLRKQSVWPGEAAFLGGVLQNYFEKKYYVYNKVCFQNHLHLQNVSLVTDMSRSSMRKCAPECFEPLEVGLPQNCCCHRKDHRPRRPRQMPQPCWVPNIYCIHNMLLI